MVFSMYTSCPSVVRRVGQNPIYTEYIRYCRQGEITKYTVVYSVYII